MRVSVYTYAVYSDVTGGWRILHNEGVYNLYSFSR
jgi:hypothetical protein